MIRLFLADDMPAVREVMRSCLLLAPGRYQVVGEAGDGLAALASIPDLSPDVIVLDVDMPGMSGLEVARQLRDLGVAAPVVLCSSWEGHESRELPVGVTHCLRKPFRIETFTRAVESAAAFGLQRD